MVCEKVVQFILGDNLFKNYLKNCSSVWCIFSHLKYALVLHADEKLYFQVARTTLNAANCFKARFFCSKFEILLFQKLLSI